MFPLLLAVALATAPPPSPRSLAVSGEAKVTFRPNQALATFVLAAAHRDPAGARRACDEKLVKLLKAVADAGVARENVVVNDASPSADYRGNEVVGYTMSRSVLLTVTDVARLDEALGAAVRGGAIPSGAVVLQNTDHATFESRARVAAATAARERAKALTEALGARLGLLVTVTDSTPSVESFSAGSFSAAPDGSVITSFASKVLTVASQVTAQFDIEPPAP